MQASSGFAEPSLEELTQQLMNGLEVGEKLAAWLHGRLRSLTSPEDLFTFFLTLRGEWLCAWSWHFTMFWVTQVKAALQFDRSLQWFF